MHSHAWVISSQLPAIFDQQEESRVQMPVRLKLSANFTVFLSYNKIVLVVLSVAKIISRITRHFTVPLGSHVSFM
jgi:hypothetical protein